MYADRITDAMRYALDETSRRRALQEAYNTRHGITPETVKKALFELDPSSGTNDYVAIPILKKGEALDPAKLGERVEELRAEMLLAAENLEFEKAARLRDELLALEGRGPEKGASASAARSERAPSKTAPGPRGPRNPSKSRGKRR